MKSNQEEDKIDHDPPAVESKKKVNERMNKMEEMIRRACKMEDLMDYDSLSLFPNARLSPKFKMPTLDKFDGTSYPKSHLKMYMRAMQPSGTTKEVLAQMFQITLIGVTLRWFLNLNDARVRSWEDICREFHNQYKYNMEVDITRRDLKTTKQEPKESFSTFITKWRAKAAQMMNRPSEEEQLAMVMKNLLPVYHKYLFSQYFPNFKALIAPRTQIEDAINNGTIKNDDLPRFKKNVGSNSKAVEISNIHKNDPHQLIAPITPMQVLQGPRSRREFHELYMPISQVFDKLKVKGLLKSLDPRPIPNPLPLKFDVNKRCAYHQGPSHDIDCCFALCHTIQDLTDNKVIAPPTRPSITNNPLPNHNFGKGPRINCLMIKEENKEDPSDLIYDLPECFMMTWEELMDRTSTTTTGYDIWNEVPEPGDYQAPTNGERHFKPQINNRIPTNGGRHFKLQINNQTPINGERHFKPQDIDLNDPTKIAHITRGRGETL